MAEKPDDDEYIAAVARIKRRYEESVTRRCDELSLKHGVDIEHVKEIWEVRKRERTRLCNHTTKKDVEEQIVADKLLQRESSPHKEDDVEEQIVADKLLQREAIPHKEDVPGPQTPPAYTVIQGCLVPI